MKIKLEYPYNEYNGYLVTNPENRRNVCLIHKTNKLRTTISYARYLMSVKEKRILNKEEQVDHIDGDKTNDVIENLQILSLKENNQKRVQETNNTRKIVKYICTGCNEIHTKPHNKTHIVKKGLFTTCSRECLYKTLSKGYTKDELRDLGNFQILEHYRL